MPMFIESLSTEFTVFDDELPLSTAQLDQVVAHVLTALEGVERRRESARALGRLDDDSARPFGRCEEGR